MSSYPITTTGLKKADNQLKHLKYEMRPQIIKEVATARAHGDLSENAEYDAAKNKQAFCEGEIKKLENIISTAHAINPSELEYKDIRFGATVDIINIDDDSKKTYSIVSDYESDISKGLISFQSPMGRAMVGKVVGDIFDIVTHAQTTSWEIEAFTYKELP